MKLKVDGKEYEEDLEIGTIMNDHFHSVFTTGSVMGKEDVLTRSTAPLENVVITVLKIKRLREELDEIKHRDQMK